MNKGNQTLLILEAALLRILSGQTKRILVTRKLSTRAVEEEAGLGNGSCYYYPEMINRIKSAKESKYSTEYCSTGSSKNGNQNKYLNEKRIKQKYRQENIELKSMIAQMAAEHHHFNDALRKAYDEISELHKDNKKLRESLYEKKGQTVQIINSIPKK